VILAAVLAVVLQQSTPQQELEAKLASPFLQRAPWQLDLASARAAAAEREQLILGYFTTAGP